MKKALFSLGRYYRTVKHLRVSQIRTRIFRRLLTAAERIPAVANLYTHSLPSYEVTELTLTRLPLPNQHYLGHSVFEFLSQKFDCKSSWFPDGASLLWRFNLHYFDFLHEIESAHEQKRFVFDWIIKVPVCHPVGWHPYTSSLRICNWIAHYPQFKQLLSEPEQQLFFSSLYNQLRHLLWHIEEDLLANHLIENCRALIVGGVFLNQERFVAHGKKVLLRELPEQVLSDGGHYERSPQYHTEVLLALLDAYAALRQSGRPIPPLLAEKLEAMTHFLAKILDFGKLPGLNDTSPEFVPDPQAVIAYAAQELQILIPSYTELDEHLTATGLFIYRSKRLSVTFDVGPIGPDVQPGHAHSDTLSVLVTVDGIPVLIDSGVYTYEAGPDRDYFRSAWAHNGPIIDGNDPNELWGAFRVGSRHLTASTTEPWSACLQHGRGTTLRRKIKIGGSAAVNISDLVLSGHPRTIETRWTFAPNIEPHTEKQDAGTYEATVGDFKVRLTLAGNDSCELEERPISLGFNIKTHTSCLISRQQPSSARELRLGIRVHFPKNSRS
jgi:hypothetical protein